jgi:hypothetical protein
MVTLNNKNQSMHNFDVGKEASILFFRIIFEKSKAKF